MVKRTESRRAPSSDSMRRRSTPSWVKPSLRGIAQAALVLRLDLDVDPLEPAELETDAGQHRRHLGRDPLPDRVRATQ